MSGVMSVVYWMWGAVGFLVGTFFGMLLAALMVAQREDDDEDR